MDVAATARFDDAFTFIFSPRPGTEAATMAARFVDPDVAGERFRRLRVVIERSALAANQARVGRVEEVLVEGPSKKDPSVLAARTPHHRLVHFAPPSGRCAPARTRPSRSPAPPPTTSRGGSSSSSPRRRTARASRSPRSEMAAAPVVVLGPTAAGKSDVAMAAARAVAGTEIVAVDAMQVYTGMDIGTAKPTPDDRRAVRHHGIDLVDPSVDFTVSDYRRGYDGWIAGIDRPLLVAGTGLYLNAVVDRLELPGRWPARARRARADDRPTSCGAA